MNAYSKDPRLRVLAAGDRGPPREEVVGTFSVSLASIKRLLKRHHETGGVEAKPIPPGATRTTSWHASSSSRPRTSRTCQVPQANDRDLYSAASELSGPHR